MQVQSLKAVFWSQFCIPARSLFHACCFRSAFFSIPAVSHLLSSRYLLFPICFFIDTCCFQSAFFLIPAVSNLLSSRYLLFPICFLRSAFCLIFAVSSHSWKKVLSSATASSEPIILLCKHSIAVILRKYVM